VIRGHRKAAFLAVAWLLACPVRAGTPEKGLDARLNRLMHTFEALSENGRATVDPIILQRPLFVPGRRPDRAGGLEDASRDGGMRSLKLRAVVRDGGEFYALIGGHSKGRLRKVHEGEEIDGWHVVEIQPDRLLLDNHGIRQELLLRRYPRPPSPPGTHRTTIGKQSGEAKQATARHLRKPRKHSDHQP